MSEGLCAWSSIMLYLLFINRIHRVLSIEDKCVLTIKNKEADDFSY